MKYTDNFNLKKPEQTDFYNVDDFNENFGTIDAEMKNRKETQAQDARDIADLKNPTFDDSGTVEGISSFPDFLSKFKSKVNIFQWFRDFKAGAQFILHAGQIVNNCVTNNPGLPLSAAQGKVLMDLYNQVNDDLNYPLYPANERDYKVVFDEIFQKIGPLGVGRYKILSMKMAGTPSDTTTKYITMYNHDLTNGVCEVVDLNGQTYVIKRTSSGWSEWGISALKSDLTNNVISTKISETTNDTIKKIGLTLFDGKYNMAIYNQDNTAIGMIPLSTI